MEELNEMLHDKKYNDVHHHHQKDHMKKLDIFRMEKLLDDKIKSKKAKTVELDFADDDIVKINMDIYNLTIAANYTKNVPAM